MSIIARHDSLALGVREFQLPRQFFKSGIGLGIAGLLKHLNNYNIFHLSSILLHCFNLVAMKKKKLSNRVVISGDLGQNFVASSHGFC